MPERLLPEFRHRFRELAAVTRCWVDNRKRCCRIVPDRTGTRGSGRAGESYGIVVAGVGGTGVVTIGALLGMAAHLEGKGAAVLDMTGLAQKGGPVTSHLRIATSPDEIKTTRIASGGAQPAPGLRSDGRGLAPRRSLTDRTRRRGQVDRQ